MIAAPQQTVSRCRKSSAPQAFQNAAKPPKPAQQRSSSGVTASVSVSRRAWSVAGASLLFSSSGLYQANPSMSMVAAAASASGAPSSKDLLIVGPGVLGAVLGKNWIETVPGGAAFGLTNSTNNHPRLQAMGLTPYTRDTLPQRKFAFVAFAAPPSGSQDYVGDVKAALQMWDGTGSFLFTSSMGVCAVDDGGLVTEDTCPTVPLGAGPSTDKLLGAEQAVLDAGGNVVRLVGLYHTQRGAHTFFIKIRDVPRWGRYTVNLLHYEDAAGIAAAILRGDGEGPFRGRIFIGADGNPVTFQDMMDACFSSGVFQGTVNFTGEPASKGKRVDNSATRKALGGWTPKYASFQEFMGAGGKDYYNQSGLW